MRKGKIYFHPESRSFRRGPAMAEPWDMLISAIIFAVIAGVLFWIMGA